MRTYQDIATDGGSDVMGQVEEQHVRLRERLAQVRRVVAVMSGKGGVGKSTLTACLAASLEKLGHVAGVLDADLNGPSMARMLGVRTHVPVVRNGSMTPALTPSGFPLMSMDLFLPQDDTPLLWRAPSQQNAYTWRSMVEMSALRELLADTDWGQLDVLLIDLPPGSERLQNLADLLPDLAGIVVVTTPTGVAQMVVGRSITMATEVSQVPVMGLVENFSAHVCSRCGHHEDVHHSTGGSARLARRHGIEMLGAIPFDAELAQCMDEGISYMESFAERAGARAIMDVARHLASSLGLS